MLTALIQRPGRLVYLSSGLHQGGEGSLADLDWTKRPWDPARAYAECKLHVVALAFALARRWPQVLSNAVDPGWARTKMGGPGAPVDLDTGQRTQTWLAVSDKPAALVSGCCWHHLRQEQPASEDTDPEFQDQLIAKLGELTFADRFCAFAENGDRYPSGARLGHRRRSLPNVHFMLGWKIGRMPSRSESVAPCRGGRFRSLETQFRHSARFRRRRCTMTSASHRSRRSSGSRVA